MAAVFLNDPSRRLRFERVPRMMTEVGLVLLMFLLSTGTLQAQNRIGRPDLINPENPVNAANPLLQLQKEALSASMQRGMTALEGAIDPEEYIVGPGDVFNISSSGVFSLGETKTVSADGNLDLPEGLNVRAAGRTLAEVKEDVIQTLRRRYRNLSLDVNLVQPRLFYVHISGAIPEPGRYLMLPIARVDDAVQQAYAGQAFAKPDPDGAPRIISSGTSERPAINEAYRPSLRNVLLMRKNGDSTSLDLLRYYATGDMSQNPYLLDGDIIQVPTYNVQRDAIRVSGEVPYPGWFDFRPGDTPTDVLLLAAGPDLSPLGEIRLTRRTATGSESMEIDLDAAQPISLQAGDHLNVLPVEQAVAVIYGMVEYPGTYPIQDGETTLRELVAMAGGLKPDADPRSAVFERRQSFAFKGEGKSSDLDFFSRTYLRRSLSANAIVIDVQEALKPGAEDVLIYDEDKIVFPRDEGTIFVTGNVMRPGYVEYVEGQPAQYYIDRTGGTGDLATGIYIFEAGSGAVHSGRDRVVRPGDTIFVDRQDIAESPEEAQLLISDQASRRQARILRTQNILTAVTATVAVIGVLDRFGFFD